MESISVLRLDRDFVDWPVMAHGGIARSVARPDVGAHHRMVNTIDFQPGGKTKPLRHEQDEAVYYVASGCCQLQNDGHTYTLERGSVALIPPDSEYTWEATSDGPASLIGGPCIGPRGTPAHERVDLQVLDVHSGGIMLPMISHEARHVVGPHVGAQVATLNFVVLDPEEGNQPHVHADAEDTIVILEGEGVISDETNGVDYPFTPGCVLLIPAGLRHTVQNLGQHPIRSIGGPCPPDISMTPGITRA